MGIDAQNNFNLGKTGNTVKLTGFKGGIKKEQIQSVKNQAIFDKVDTDHNHILTDNEIAQFQQEIQSAAKDETLSKKEANNYLKEQGLNKSEIKGDDLFNFMSSVDTISQKSDIEKAEVITGQNGDVQTVLTSKNGNTVETINSDNTSTVLNKTDKDSTLSSYDANHNLVQSEVKDEVAKTTTTTQYITSSDNKSIPQSTITKGEGFETTVQYDESGNPTSKTEKRGTTVSTYSYKNGVEQLDKKEIDKGNGVVVDTDYSYDSNGDTIETTQDGESTTVLTKPKDGNATEVTTDANGNKATSDVNQDGHKLNQTKTVNGKTYSVEYDGNGNTKGIVVQNGESPATLAKKFGCSEEDILALNKDALNGKKYFNVGDSIKVPGEVVADSPALQGRKTADEAIADYKAHPKTPELKFKNHGSGSAVSGSIKNEELAAKRAAAKAKKQATLQSLGVVNTRGAGQKRVGYLGQQNLKTRRKSPLKYTVVGQTGIDNREIVKGSNGKYYTMAKDGTILKESYVNNTNFFAKSKKVKGTRVVNGKTVTAEYAVVGNLDNGRKAVIDSKGRSHVMSHDGKILNNTYIQNKRTSDAIRHNPATAQKATISFLENSLNSAQKSFDKQMAKDGWAADVADFVSNEWGQFQEEGNQAFRVRKDLKQSRQNLTILKAAAKKGDAAFASTFKKLYGVPYSQNAVADYMSHPTEANYKKAFGNKNISKRVANYNSSQDTGAEVVKTTATIAAGIAIGAVTGGVGAAALATGAASFAINSSDRVSSKQGLQKGELKEIAIDAAFDAGSVVVGGAAGKVGSKLFRSSKVVLSSGQTVESLTKGARIGRAAVDVTGDVSYGAAQEYAQTGNVTVTGTLLNGATAVVGQGINSRAVKKAGSRFKNSVANAVEDTRAKFHTKITPDVVSAPKVEVSVGASTEGRTHIIKPPAEKAKVNTKNTSNVSTPKSENSAVSSDKTNNSAQDERTMTFSDEAELSKYAESVAKENGISLNSDVSSSSTPKAHTASDEVKTVPSSSSQTTYIPRTPQPKGKSKISKLFSKSNSSSAKPKEHIKGSFDDVMANVAKVNNQAELSPFIERLNDKSLSEAQRNKLQDAIRTKKNQLSEVVHESNVKTSDEEVKDLSLKAHKKLEFGKSYRISDNARIKLGKSYSLDLRKPSIRNKISNLKNGESLTIGRGSDADIQISAGGHMDISREHAVIEKVGDQLYFTESSTNGSKLNNDKKRVASATKGIITREIAREGVEDEKKDILNNLGIDS